MKRPLNLLALTLVALLVLLFVTGSAAAQGSMDKGSPHGGMIPELRDVPKDQLFEHFRGSQFTITDAQGNAVTYVVTPGVVTTLSATSISVTPTGQAADMTFTITADTVVRGMPARGSLQSVAAGDKVVILSRQGGDAAVTIMKHDPTMMRYHRGGIMMEGR